MNAVIELIETIELPGVFNPYTSECPELQENGAAAIRMDNLRQYLTRVVNLQPEIAWFGEALGHRGGRRTGLPFSDDYTISRFSDMYEIEVVLPHPPTKPEVTATVIWDEIASLPDLPFLWNVFPFHPCGQSHLSNRKPRISELSATADLTHKVLEFSDFTHILAVGRTAQQWLERLGYDTVYIRHPSHGGITRFREQIREFYSV